MKTRIPAELEGLRTLALNLRWSWHAPTRELFERLNPAKFEGAAGNPVALLAALTEGEWRQLATDPDVVQRVARQHEDLVHYLDAVSWFDGSDLADGTDGLRSVAYFSAEYGLTHVLPQYSGGLGILAGDHLKSVSDLGVPLTAVGLFYKSGYFRQSLDRDGYQQESYPVLDLNELPVTTLEEADGRPVDISVALPDGRTLHAAVRLVQVGRVLQVLLDADVPENDPDLRELTFRLYGGGGEQRLRQEMLLGIGGVRALRAVTRLRGLVEPQVYHCNEGHAGFLGVERISELAQDRGLTFDVALRAVRAGTVFTTHTPVPAGIDRFGLDLVRDHFSGAAALPGVPTDRVLALGSENYPGGDLNVFNMAVMGLRLAARANGVSVLHGEVSRGMFRALWPGLDVDEVPITSITNGVHAPTWLADRAFGFFHDRLGSAPDGSPVDFARAEQLDDAELWRLKRELRSELVDDVRRRMRAAGTERSFTPTELGWTDTALDPDVLTIGFARRAPTYKRLTLMLRDPERLVALLAHPERPIQLVVAGKAHPADEQGKRLIQQLVRFADRHDVRHRIVFMPDYDMEMARTLYPGCDVWLNNPLRPFEASGTSGMKAAINGALNLSILDGWWDEWYEAGNGWAIPTADGVEDDTRRDDLEAAALYELLEDAVAPTYYRVDDDGLPREWIAMMKHTLADLGPKVMATRMVRQYTEQMCAPAAASWREFSADDFALARRNAEQLAAAQRAFPHVHIDAVEVSPPDAQGASDIEVYATLGGLEPDAVTLEVLTGPVDGSGELTVTTTAVIGGAERLEPERYRYVGRVTFEGAGGRGLAVRLVPRLDGAVGPADAGLVVNA